MPGILGTALESRLVLVAFCWVAECGNVCHSSAASWSFFCIVWYLWLGSTFDKWSFAGLLAPSLLLLQRLVAWWRVWSSYWCRYLVRIHSAGRRVLPPSSQQGFYWRIQMWLLYWVSPSLHDCNVARSYFFGKDCWRMCFLRQFRLEQSHCSHGLGNYEISFLNVSNEGAWSPARFLFIGLVPYPFLLPKELLDWSKTKRAHV